ncbi:MAG: DNA polymerase [Anaerovoracaceae bacterium]
MKELAIDIETFSSNDLKKSGVYKYAESDDFEILLFAYSVDNEDINIIDLANGEMIPKDILDALTDTSVIKWAFNANFERICLSKYLGVKLEPKSWRCSMVWSATLGLPLSLEGVGKVLGLTKQKLEEGKSHIRYFCVPCKPSKVNGGRTRNLRKHDVTKWEEFKNYNIRDVEAEMEVKRKLSRFPVPEQIWKEYELDQEINDRGIGLDMDFVKSAIALDGIIKDELISEMKKLTGLENPNSVMQLKEWLKEKGKETDSLDKKAIEEILKTAKEELKEVLTLRQQISKSSVKKYTAMDVARGMDNRARGMFMFYGANRTGRFAGRIIQLQNLPKNIMPDLKESRALVKMQNIEALKMLYENIPDTLSQLVRTAFVPQNNTKFIVADFSAIEARVIAWLAGEKWRLKAFENGEDIYCASASRMFQVNVVKHGENGHLRQKGKIAELALGYGGSVGALTAMGALDMGLLKEELKPLVDAWRFANPNITKLWWDIDRAVKLCIKKRIPSEIYNMKIFYESGFLFIRLPSGRVLSYVKPRMGENKFGGESVTYEGIGMTKKWERLESYGPKFVENIVQGIARDLLVYAMEKLRAYKIVAHVHDEVIIEAPRNMKVEEICKIMSEVPPWATGLKLDADGYECEFYKKD